MSINKIESIGNLPKALQIFAKQVRDAKTVFYECTLAKDIEDVAKKKECEELSCVLDPTTERGFLVGFGFADTEQKIIIPGKDTSVDMIIYFTELEAGDFKRYDKMLKQHKRDQQADMYRRRNLAKPSNGGSNDQ